VKKYVLLTGATGLVGRYLIRDLQLAGHRLAVVTRASEKENPVERIEAILQMWESQLGAPLARPVILEGDVTEPSFGFSNRDKAWVRDHCDRILHNAAVLTFDGQDRSGEPWRSNLKGAQHALDLAEEVGIDEFHHVSTAYVAGTRKDLVREDELDVGQKFRNDYEESKFLAEKLVRSASFLRSLTVYRPAVIAGDSKTGYTSTYHGLYVYMKLMALVKRQFEPDENGQYHTPFQVHMTGDEPRNIVPVDWVSAVMCRIFSSPALHGKTYHLSPRECTTPRKIIEAGYRYFNSYGVEFLGPALFDSTQISDLNQAAIEGTKIYESYTDSDPLFDTSNVDAALPDLPCPCLDVDMMARYFEFGEKDRWGKRRAPRPNVPFWVGRFLSEESSRHHAAPDSGDRNNRNSAMVGIDVYGPGGGQWCLGFTGEHLTSVTPGLPVDLPYVSLSSADFARLVQKNECLTVDDLHAFASRDVAEKQVDAGDHKRVNVQRSFVPSSDQELSMAVRRPSGE
jgi:thioester reductase-like protein